MLLEELAKDMVEVTSALIGGRTINIMNTDGVIIASSEHERIGSYHQGAREAVRTGKVVNIRKDQLDRYPGAKEGCNFPLRVNGAIIGVVGIFGEPDEIRDVAHLLEVYAAKYYQLEAMMRPRLSESVLRSQLLTNLLSPSDGSLSAVPSLMQTLNVHFDFPVYTVVFSSPQGLSLTENIENLCSRLEKLGFQQSLHDLWGAVDQRLVLLCSSQENRCISELQQLTAEGYRVSIGTPCNALRDIHASYEQASILDSASPKRYNDIRQTDTHCTYVLSKTAVSEEAFLEELYRKLLDAFGDEDSADLLASIGTYYECGKSVTLAAQQRFIHKNTLQYRVKRVLDAMDIGKLPAFWQEYLVRLVLEHHNRKSRSQDLEK